MPVSNSRRRPACNSAASDVAHQRKLSKSGTGAGTPDQVSATSAAATTNTTQWISFSDEDHTTWLFDLTFLTSGWQCTFGNGCQGTEPGDNGARGCCAHGAYLIDADEKEHLIAMANRLSPEQWQLHHHADEPEDLFELIDDEPATRRIDDACIFLNRVGFDGGHGCALHIGALAHGERPLDWKPTVCWQVPFRLEEYEDGAGTRTVVVRAWRRSDWGDGGHDFGWWCTDQLPEVAPEGAAWIRHQDELIALVGERPVALLNDYLTETYLGTNDVTVALTTRSARKQ